MAINNTNLFVSLALLQNTTLPKEKQVAAAVGSALVPGLLGVALPLILAAQNRERDTKGDGTQPEPPSTGATGDQLPPGGKLRVSPPDASLAKH
ncbi:MAG: hypothetical protein ACXU8N_11770 [Telluria sp.]